MYIHHTNNLIHTYKHVMCVQGYPLQHGLQQQKFGTSLINLDIYT
jgi:hypothetical protein